MSSPEFNLTQHNQTTASTSPTPEELSAELAPSQIDQPSRISSFTNELITASNITRASLIGATIAALVFEQSPANEAVRVSIALNTLENTDSTVWAGGAVAAATLAIEGGTSSLVAVGLHQEQDKVKRITGRFKKKNAPDLDDIGNVIEKNRTLSTKTADLAIALGIGPAIAMTKRHIEDVEPTLQKDLKRGLGYSAIGAAVSGAAAYLVTGGVQRADEIGMEKPAEYVIEYGTDTKFWLGVLAVIYGAKGLNKLATNVRHKYSQNGGADVKDFQQEEDV